MRFRWVPVRDLFVDDLDADLDNGFDAFFDDLAGFADCLDGSVGESRAAGGVKDSSVGGSGVGVSSTGGVFLPFCIKGLPINGLLGVSPIATPGNLLWLT